jgi:hypothetical protein
MAKQNLTRASGELFRRSPDERFASLEALLSHCEQQKQESVDHWIAPSSLIPEPIDDRLGLRTGVGVSVERLEFQPVVRQYETPTDNKPLQLFTRSYRVPCARRSFRRVPDCLALLPSASISNPPPSPMW